MPRGDKTGPAGLGPKTGRGMGPCGSPNGRRQTGAGYGYGYGFGRGWGRGWGRVMCGWMNRQFQAMPEKDRKEVLREELEDIKQEAKLVEEEMKALEK